MGRLYRRLPVDVRTEPQSSIYVFTQDRGMLKFLNFNPAIDFSKGDSPKWGDLLRSSLTQATIIGVFAPYSFTNESVIYGVASGDGGDSLVINDKIVHPVRSRRLTMEIPTARISGIRAGTP